MAPVFTWATISKKRDKEGTADEEYSIANTKETTKETPQTETPEPQNRGAYVVVVIISVIIILITIVDVWEAMDQGSSFPILKFSIGIGVGVGFLVLCALIIERKIKIRTPDIDKYVPKIAQPLLLGGIGGTVDGLIWGWVTNFGPGEGALLGFIILFGIALTLFLSNIPLMRKHGWKSEKAVRASEEIETAVHVVGYTAFLIGLLALVGRWANS